MMLLAKTDVILPSYREKVDFKDQNGSFFRKDFCACSGDFFLILWKKFNKGMHFFVVCRAA